MTNVTGITMNTVICRNEKKFLANALGDEMVMMNMQSGDFISVNSVGADIWNLTQTPTSLKELVRKLLEVYDIGENQCFEETIKFLESSASQELFILTNPNGI